MARNSYLKHAREVARLQKKVTAYKRRMALAWRSIKHDPELKRLKRAAASRQALLEKKTIRFCYNCRRYLNPLEAKLQRAKEAHASLIHRKTLAWLEEVRGSSPNRRKWTLAWATPEEDFALVRKPRLKLLLGESTVQSYGLRYELYDLRGTPTRALEFIGRPSPADWAVVYKFIADARAQVKATA